MATRGSIEAVFAAAGIETLAVEDGVDIFVAEALQGGKRRVLGCGSLGLMDRFDSFESAAQVTTEHGSDHRRPNPFPLRR